MRLLRFARNDIERPVIARSEATKQSPLPEHPDICGGQYFNGIVFAPPAYTDARSKKQEFGEAPLEGRGRPEPFHRELPKHAGQ